MCEGTTEPRQDRHNRVDAMLRSRTFFQETGVSGFLHRAFIKSMGYDDLDVDRPVIGICNTWSELNNCHGNFPELIKAVRRGVLQGGGLPLEFPTISLGEIFLNPTSMFLRNLAAMDTEEMIRSQPLDGVVLLVNCDKTIPAAIMGALSADLPSIVLSGGPMLNGHFKGQTLGACSDCRRLTAEYQAGTLSAEDYAAVEDGIVRSQGHCMVMGTASTMNCVCEALGISLPGNGATPAVDSRRLRLGVAAGRRIVELARAEVRPSDLLSRESFENAITLLCSLGGSTNAVVHLCAIARRMGLALDLDLFDGISRRTPMLTSLRPSGDYQMEEMFEAGGVSVVLRQLLPLLHGDARTVTGRTLGENVADAPEPDGVVTARLEQPFQPEGGLAVLKGNLAPKGAVIKHSAASPALMQHTGRALVFRDYNDLQRRIHAPDLDVGPHDVLVLQNSGPVGGPGMPEIGNLPIPRKLLQQGVRDMVRISDARMSGTAFGTIVLHVSPESAVGGPVALVEDGDRVELDVSGRRLELKVSETDLARRRARWAVPEPDFDRGYGQLFLEHVTQADEGCDFDFLHGRTPVKAVEQPKL